MCWLLSVTEMMYISAYRWIALLWAIQWWLLREWRALLIQEDPKLQAVCLPASISELWSTTHSYSLDWGVNWVTNERVADWGWTMFPTVKPFITSSCSRLSASASSSQSALVMPADDFLHSISTTAYYKLLSNFLTSFLQFLHPSLPPPSVFPGGLITGS